MKIRPPKCWKLRELAIRHVEDSIVDDGFCSANKGLEILDGWGTETTEDASFFTDDEIVLRITDVALGLRVLIANKDQNIR